MAEGSQEADPVHAEGARKTVQALVLDATRLDWEALHMTVEPASAKKLIAAKLAS
ncbi:hypothetical protein ACIBCO_39005 [Streptomyces violascens]|uniref:hypothetical protein n=1 Tax=Streptomyces violascens TaxID=67381 RepID=UPI0037B78568